MLTDVLMLCHLDRSDSFIVAQWRDLQLAWGSIAASGKLQVSPLQPQSARLPVEMTEL